MELPSGHEVTRLLKAWSAGDEQALEKLTPLVYGQLHQIAQRYMRGERVALDDAPNALAAVDKRKRKVVELKFFGGLSVEETAEVLRVSSDTVIRDWRLAKLWLLRVAPRRGKS